MNLNTVPKRWLGAFKRGHRKASQTFIDEELSYDLLKRVIESNYTDEESMNALDYITKFNNEYHKNVIKKDDPNALHNTDELRRSCYALENARNRDMMSITNITDEDVEGIIERNEYLTYPKKAKTKKN